MKRKNLSIVTIFSIFLLWGCYPNGPDYVEELDVVVTYHVAEYDFVAQATYAMPDKIVKVTGDLADGETPEYMPDATASKILKMIADNMTALGYTKVAQNANPDLYLLPASWQTTTVYWWYDYWYWWYGGYWGGYYPPYYPPVSVSSYTTGTLIMNLVDKDVVNANGDPIIQWSGAINGLLTGAYDATCVNTAINKAFDQSPYLKTN
jgi:hypothetical protein